MRLISWIGKRFTWKGVTWQRLAWKRVWTVWLVAAVLVPAAAWGALWWINRQPAGLAGKLLATEGNLSCVTFSPDGRWIAAGAASGNVLLWDVATRIQIPLTQLSQQQITCLAVTPDGFLVAGTMSQRLFVWELRSRRAKRIPPLAAPVTCLAPHPVRKEIAIGLSNGTLVFLDTMKGEFSEVVSGHKGAIKALAYRPDGKSLVSAGDDGKLIWRNAVSRRTERTLEGHDGEVSCLRFSPNGLTLASGDLNGGVIFWRVADGEVERRLAQADAVSGLGFTAEHLVMGSWDHHLRFWSIENEKVAASYDTGKVIQALAVSVDQTRIATVSPANEVLLWKVP